MSPLATLPRLLRRQPGFSLLAVATLALGIGLSTVLFSVVHGLMLRPLPFPDSERWVAVGLAEGRLTAGHFRQWREEATSFESLVAFSMSYVFVTGTEGGTRAYPGAEVTPGFFELTGVSPILGRPLSAEDGRSGTAPTAVVSHQVWRELFGGRPDVVGQPVRLNQVLHTVVGVMPPGFAFPHSQGVWIAARLPSDAAPGEGPPVEVVGKLRPGASAATAAAELSRLGRTPAVVTVEPYVRAHTDPRIRRALPLMVLAVVGVLLVACLNVASLFLIRTSKQQHELAVAAALGAGRWRLALGTLVEIAGLALLATGLGLLLAVWGLRVFHLAMEPAGMFEAFWVELEIAPAVALFAFVAAVAAGCLAATLPLAVALRTSPAEALRQHAAGGARRPAGPLGRLLQGLVVVEVALSCALLVLAGLMVESIVSLRMADHGFDGRDVVTARVSIAQDPNADEARTLAFFDRLTRELEADPQVERVAYASSIPTRGSFWAPLFLEGREGSESERVRWLVISEGFLDALDASVLAGRGIEPTDLELFPPVALVNRAFVERFFPGESAIGNRLRLHRAEAEPVTIVGVVPNLTMGEVDEERSSAAVYLPLAQNARGSMEVLVEAAGSPAALLPLLESTVRALDPLATVFYTMPMDEVLRRRRWLHEALATLFSIFGLVATALAVVGLGGVVALLAHSRRREHGIRLAVGASPRRLLRGVLRSALAQVGLGVGLGLAAAAGLARLVSSRVFGVEAWDPAVYGAVVVLLLAAGLIAALAPAVRAARVDPVEVLRDG